MRSFDSRITAVLLALLNTESSAFSPAAAAAKNSSLNNNNNNMAPTTTRLFQSTTSTSSSSSNTAVDDAKINDKSRPKSASYIVDPAERDRVYGANMAQYLLDLHDSQAVFDFCGGMLFQLDLTDALRQHLQNVVLASNNDDDDSSKQQQQPILYESNKLRMHQLATYQKSSFADNVSYFHGREIRQVPTARGGMGMVLQLSLAPPSDYALANHGNLTPPPKRVDPQGWSDAEMATYDGWGSDRGRVWRQGTDYEREGFEGGFRKKYGPKSFGLNHRFYLHKDFKGKMWLAAEDGCEGTPVLVNNNKPGPLESLMKRFV